MGDFDPSVEQQINQIAAQFGDFSGLTRQQSMAPPSISRTPSVSTNMGLVASLQEESQSILEKYQKEMQEEIQKARKSREALTEAAQRIIDVAKKNKLGVINKDSTQQDGSP
jgi:hypothetical protein